MNPSPPVYTRDQCYHKFPKQCKRQSLGALRAVRVMQFDVMTGGSAVW